MRHITYSTGRTYDAPQILDILIESYGTDEYGLGIVTATFTDSSRHIKGKVIDAPVFDNNIGAAVLSSYDNGFYQSI